MYNIYEDAFNLNGASTVCRLYMGQVMKVHLSCNLALLSNAVIIC